MTAIETADGKPMPPVPLSDILTMIARWERRLIDATCDGMVLQTVKLEIHPDGSGDVCGYYSRRPSVPGIGEALAAIDDMERHSLLEFDSIDDLHGHLVAHTMGVRKQP
jgi:hypothetical protein